MESHCCPICQSELIFNPDKKTVICTHCGYQAFPLGQNDLTIDVFSVKEKLKKGEPFILVDVRGADERKRAVISDALWIPLSELPQSLDKLPVNREIIVHCHFGGRSFHATRFLMQKGFKNVKSLDGGIDAWSSAIDAAIPHYG